MSQAWWLRPIINFSIWEAETGGLPCAPHNPGLHSSKTREEEREGERERSREISQWVDGHHQTNT